MTGKSSEVADVLKRRGVEIYAYRKRNGKELNNDKVLKDASFTTAGIKDKKWSWYHLRIARQDLGNETKKRQSDIN